MLGAAFWFVSTLKLLGSTLQVLNEVFPPDHFFPLQYNEELHYVEPCLNGTLVQADRTNKEVGAAAGWERAHGTLLLIVTAYNKWVQICKTLCLFERQRESSFPLIHFQNT